MKNLLIFSFILLISAYCSAKPKSFLPTKQELLKDPITLESCNGIQVVEWKQSKFNKVNFDRSEVKSILNETCKDVFVKYSKFIKLRFNEDVVIPKLNVKASFLPANIFLDGRESRNLNDSDRFIDLRHPGDCCVWGVYIYTSKVLFLREDMFFNNGQKELNPFFIKTFIHEITHVLNNFTSVKINFLDLSDQKDEDLVLDFLRSMDLDKISEDTESNKKSILGLF
jgi:uncharacterized protein YcfL